MSGYIGKISDGTNTRPVASTLYGTCATAAATAAKAVTCTDFDTLISGVTIFVKFTYTNTAAKPTLNVNDTGAKYIMRYGTTAPSNSAETSWNAGSVVAFTYDGTYWQMVGWLTPALVGATTENAGTAGYAPAPAKGAANRYLRSDGTWQVPPDTNTTYSSKAASKDGTDVSLVTTGEKYTWGLASGTATSSADGLMSSTDKSKLDGIAASANNYSLPDASTTTKGGVKLGSDTKQTTAANTVTTTTSRTYAVQKNNSGQLVVNVPWTNTTYSSVTAASGGTATGLVTAGEKFTWNSKVSSPIKSATLSGTTLTLTLA